jgi:hypothetical protein
MFTDVTWINNQLDKIGESDNPRQALAEWFNQLNGNQQESVFSFAGWLDTKGFVGHYMRTDGSDKIFEEFAESLSVR